MELGDAGGYRAVGGLETVRALHQTIVALRNALEESKNEILELKAKAWPIESVQEVIQSLSIENHVLRQQLIEHGVDSPKKTILPKEETDNISAQKSSQPKDLSEENLVHVEDNDNLIQNEKNYHLSASTAQTIESDGVAGLSPKDIKAVHVESSQGSTESKEFAEEIEEIVSEDESKKFDTSSKVKKVTIVTPKVSPKVTPKVSPRARTASCHLETRILIKAEKQSRNSSSSRSLESLTILKSPLQKKLSFSKTFSFSNLASVSREFKFSNKIDSEVCNDIMSDKENNQSAPRQKADDRTTEDETEDNQYDEEPLSPQNELDQEVDDIELIFTTDETRDQDFKEELVPIDARESNSNLLNLPLSDLDQISDRELDDDVFNDTVEESNPDSRLGNYHQSSFEMKRESSIFNSRSDNSINHEKSLKSYYSYQDSSFENKSLEKDESFDRFEERVRIIETDISKCGIHEVEYVGSRRNTCPNPIQYRPLSHREAISKGLTPRKCRPILTYSNAIRRESGAQTDISALPRSAWRSESSLANKSKMGGDFTTLPSKYPLPGSRLKLSDKTVEARRVLLSDIGFTSMVPELSRSADHLCPGALKPPTVTSYGQFLKATDLYSPGCLSQKFTWTATTATPSESQTPSRYSSIYPLSPPATSRRCSAPVSPSRRAMLKSTPSRVRFANGSLPELRSDWTTVDSGDSTDSLVDEAENYLRRSIDCITNKEPTTYGEVRRTVPRRASAPEPSRDNIPPQGWQPFLPRLPRDLKLDNWVKVITPEGKVRGGRVRYVGPVATQGQEQYVGVQLACPEGVCDGTYSGRRYFQCEPYHGIFVPFKKVIMGWRP